MVKDPVRLEQVLWDELRHLEFHDEKPPAPSSVAEVYGAVHRNAKDGRPLKALCFSGGGIRSATFNLGVIQALAEKGLLKKFHYLSSVSGGGYIAGWLKAWAYRVPIAEIEKKLSDPVAAAGPAFDPLNPEPEPLDHLREYSNYLTPRLGLFSADGWALAAIILRNLILNWLVLVPVLLSFVSIPQVTLALAAATVWNPDMQRARYASAVGLGLALVASAAIHYYRRHRREARQGRIILCGLAPLWAASVALSWGLLWCPLEDLRAHHSGTLWAFCAAWCLGAPLGGWLLSLLPGLSSPEGPPLRADLVGIVASGIATTAVLFGVIGELAPELKARPPLFVIFGVPLLLGVYLLARTLFVAFASIGERAHEEANGDREWWARLSGWVLLLAVAWVAYSALVLLGGFYFERFVHAAVATVGGISGIAAAFLGSSVGTGAESSPTTRQPPSPLKEAAARLLAPLTLVCIVVVFAKISTWAVRWVVGLSDLLRIHDLRHVPPPEARHLPHVFLAFLLIPLLLCLISLALGFVVDVNRFSLQGLYRNRLVRAYLGASNMDRMPNPFTGFAENDDIPLDSLRRGASPRPLPVINASLNLICSAERLAWQQRKAESFSMTPLYCGNLHEGYRPSAEYAGNVSLGTAMTISGAAANPSAGYHSSALVSFLMTLFNMRLGSWLGNTNEHGACTYGSNAPRHAWHPLFGDLLGMTDAEHPYISLSDGGHFENLAVYEMILRRCHYMVVSDAGQDPGHDFEDLGNLIRKVRIDFGVEIEFDKPIRILARSSSEKFGLLCALGRVRYDLVDAHGVAGQLLYIKPTLLAKGKTTPYDVTSYSNMSKLFPHEPTSDQWFSESQFESYRALGRHLASQLGSGESPFDDVPGLFAAVERTLSESA